MYVVHRNLYVVPLRPRQSRKSDTPLTRQERLEGWFEASDYGGPSYAGIQSNEGHSAGLLHTPKGPHLLTWNPAPGDSILARFDVQFTAETAGPNAYRFTSAQLYRELLTRTGKVFCAFCESVLGRAVSLGEDGAEDAFGHDELRRTLESAIHENDWRDVQCDYRLEEVPDEPVSEEQESFEDSFVYVDALPDRSEQ